MKAHQTPNQPLLSANQVNRFAIIDKMVQHHSDPDPICYMPPQRTEND